MPRYVTKASFIRDWWGDEYPVASEVIIDDERPTGILDANGTPPYRVREPVGFRLTPKKRD